MSCIFISLLLFVITYAEWKTVPNFPKGITDGQRATLFKFFRFKLTIVIETSEADRGFLSGERGNFKRKKVLNLC